MQVPLQIVFHGMDPSDAVEARIRERAALLERFSDRITSCHVTVDAPHQRHRQGMLYDVRVQVRLPGRELTISRDAQRDHAHEDVYVAIRDAFDALQRKLEDAVREQDHRAKSHEPPRGPAPGSR